MARKKKIQINGTEVVNEQIKENEDVVVNIKANLTKEEFDEAVKHIDKSIFLTKEELTESLEKVVSSSELYGQVAAQVVVESQEVKPKHKPDAVPTVPFYFTKR